MSGPYSSLRKYRKVPLPSSTPQLDSLSTRNMQSSFQEPIYSNDEAKLLDEIASNMNVEKEKKLSKLPINPMKIGLDPDSHRCTPENSLPKTVPSDKDLLSVMMSRLTNLEKRVQLQSMEIAEKDRKILILEEKNQLLSKARGEQNSDSNDVIELEKKCLLLQQQVHEMETFLEEYGMIWVGEESDPSCEVYVKETTSNPSLPVQKTWSQAASLSGEEENTFLVDYDLILRNIRELNADAGEGIGEVHKTTDGARIRIRDPIPLILYANGIVMFGGPFRPFTDPETQLCVLDLMDGYFPSELQRKYPEGVPITVTDKREVVFEDKREIVFTGAGQVLGGDGGPSRLVPSNMDQGEKSKIRSEYLNKNKANHASTSPPDVMVESQIPAFARGPQLSADQFLERLPRNVVTQGRVIDIRDSVGKVLKGAGDRTPNEVTVIETDSVKEIKGRLQSSRSRVSTGSRSLTTLRIKSESGSHTYILKMKFTDTIGDVRNYIRRERPHHASNFEIASAFPRKTYSDDSATLLECGLCPNATLHLKSI